MERTELERLLPSVYRRAIREGDPLDAILGVMGALHRPVEETLSQIEWYLDPYRAPDSFVPYLATWVDLDRLFDPAPPEEGERMRGISSGVNRLREMVRRAAELSRRRGTSIGLADFLRTALGAANVRIEDPARDATGSIVPFHVRILVSEEAQRHEPLIRRIIEDEKPAAATYELRFATLATS